MTKIDNSYKERLAEVLYDDKKVINYKGVSIMLGVHVNIAKQMLYHFYKTEKEKGKSIYATYFLSGMLPRAKLAEIGTSSDKKSTDETPSQSSMSEELEAFLVLVCRDSDLERYKEKFSKIFSIHIYALSEFPLENFEPLEQLAQQKLVDSEGRTPVDFGPIICSRGLKTRKTNCPVVPREPVSKDVSKISSTTVKNDGTKTRNVENRDKKAESSEVDTNKTSSSKDEEEQSQSQKPRKKPIVPTQNNKDRLKNMFASAASKPKAKAEKVEEKSDSKEKTLKQGKETSSKELNRKNSDSRKRKRIRDVLSSDSEEAEQDDDVAEVDSPESPLPKRLQVIVSDSDEDMEKSPEKPSIEPVKQISAPGRKRVSKTVSKSYVDKDGFLVTTKEQVMVSEDEGEASEQSSSKDVQDNKTTAPTQTNSKVKKSELQQPKSNSSKTATAAGKTKQASLMNFFKKK